MALSFGRYALLNSHGLRSCPCRNIVCNISSIITFLNISWGPFPICEDFSFCPVQSRTPFTPLGSRPGTQSAKTLTASICIFEMSIMIFFDACNMARICRLYSIIHGPHRDGSGHAPCGFAFAAMQPTPAVFHSRLLTQSAFSCSCATKYPWYGVMIIFHFYPPCSILPTIA